jgi:predicted polyphosphate/ATP-dependent NAD kinase
MMAGKVGIIANPASGKDIRRLVAFASVCDNMEKVNMVRRSVLGMASAGVDEIIIMPDTFGIGGRVITGLEEAVDMEMMPPLNAKISLLDMHVAGTDVDSATAARLMDREGVGCILVVGGDGTTRAVAKGCGETPILPLSTGTNNVVPFMIESTVAGLAAGLIADRTVSSSTVTARSKKLHVKKLGEDLDMALVDVVVTDDLFVGSRAVWDMSKVRQVVVTRGEPTNIGMSSISGMFLPVRMEDPFGVSLKLGKGGITVTAPIAPGLIQEVEVKEYRKIGVGEYIGVEFKPTVLALDGEREIEVYEEDDVRIHLERDGPLIVNVEAVLGEAATKGRFKRRTT